MAEAKVGYTSSNPTTAARASNLLGLIMSSFVLSFSVDHRIGGGAYDDRTIGTDVVESLEGRDFACGALATFLVEISVDDNTTHPVGRSTGNNGAPQATFPVQLEGRLPPRRKLAPIPPPPPNASHSRHCEEIADISLSASVASDVAI